MVEGLLMIVETKNIIKAIKIALIIQNPLQGLVQVFPVRFE